MRRRIVCIFAVLASVIPGAALDCLGSSVQVDTSSCVVVLKLDHDRDLPEALNQANAARHCDRLTVGGKKCRWHLPKVENANKNRGIARLLKKMKGNETFIWLGLRRYGPKTNFDLVQWSKDHHWYWTRDNMTLDDLKRQNLDFWARNEPDNSRGRRTKDWNQSEDCAVAFVAVDVDAHDGEAYDMLKFQDRACVLKPSEDIDVSIAVYLCECILADPKPFVEQWYFYVICVLLVVVPIAVVVAVVVCVCKRKKRMSGSSRGRYPAGKRSPASRIGRRKWSVEGVPPYERMGPGSEDSTDMDLPSGMTYDKKPVKAKSALEKKSVKSVSAQIFPQSKRTRSPKSLGGASKLAEISGDEEEHKYSNVEPQAKPKKVGSIHPLKKATSTKSVCSIPAALKKKAGVAKTGNISDDEEEHYSNVEPLQSKKAPLSKKR